jgi:hypothetical protein
VLKNICKPRRYDCWCRSSVRRVNTVFLDLWFDLTTGILHNQMIAAYLVSIVDAAFKGSSARYIQSRTQVDLRRSRNQFYVGKSQRGARKFVDAASHSHLIIRPMSTFARSWGAGCCSENEHPDGEPASRQLVWNLHFLGAVLDPLIGHNLHAISRISDSIQSRNVFPERIEKCGDPGPIESVSSPGSRLAT